MVLLCSIVTVADMGLVCNKTLHIHSFRDSTALSKTSFVNYIAFVTEQHSPLVVLLCSIAVTVADVGLVCNKTDAFRDSCSSLQDLVCRLH